jgi:hypothetical protein
MSFQTLQQTCRMLKSLFRAFKLSVQTKEKLNEEPIPESMRPNTVDDGVAMSIWEASG